MASKLEIMLELEKRGKLPPDKLAMLGELKKRVTAQQPQNVSVSDLDTEGLSSPIGPSPEYLKTQPIDVQMRESLKNPDLSKVVPGPEMIGGFAGGLNSLIANIINTGKDVVSPQAAPRPQFNEPIPSGKFVDEVFGGEQPGGWQQALGMLLKQTPPGMIAEKLGATPETQKELLSSLVTPGDIVTGVGLGKGLGKISKFAGEEFNAMRSAAPDVQQVIADLVSGGQGAKALSGLEARTAKEAYQKLRTQPNMLDALIGKKEILPGETLAPTRQLTPAEQILQDRPKNVANAPEVLKSTIADRQHELDFRQQQLSDLLQKNKDRAKEAKGLVYELTNLDKQIKSRMGIAAVESGKTGMLGPASGAVPEGQVTDLNAMMQQRDAVMQRIKALNQEGVGVSTSEGAVKAGTGGVVSGGELPVSGISEQLTSVQQRVKDLESGIERLRQTPVRAVPKPVEINLQSDPITGQSSFMTPVKVADEVIKPNEYDILNQEIGNESAKFIVNDQDKGLYSQIHQKMRSFFANTPVLRSMQRVSERLSNIGPKAAEAFIRERGMYNAWERMNGRWNSELATKIDSQLTDAEQVLVAKAAAGWIPMTELPAKLYKYPAVMKQITDEMWLAGKQSGMTGKALDGSIKNFGYLSQFFPVKMSKDLVASKVMKILSANSTEEALALMSEAGIPESRAKSLVEVLANKETQEKFTTISQKARLGAEKRAGFQQTRVLKPEDYKALGLPEPRWDKAVLHEYAGQMSRKVAENIAYGPKQEKLKEILVQIGLDHGGESDAYRYAKSYVDSIVNPETTKHGDSWMNTLRSLNVFRLGPTTAVPQIQQILTSAALGSNTSFLKGIKAAWAEDAVTQARKMGVSLSEDSYTLNKLYGIDDSQSSLIREAGNKYTRLFGVPQLDAMARRVAAVTGNERAYELFKILKESPKNGVARRFFEDFGFGFSIDDALKRGHLLPSEADNAGRFFNKQINFWSLISDLPPIMNTNVGKLIFQFKPQSFMQTMMIKDVLLKEAVNGNPFPLMKYAFTGYMMDKAYGGIQNVLNLKFTEGDEGVDANTTDAVLSGQSLGLIGDEIKNWQMKDVGPSYNPYINFGLAQFGPSAGMGITAAKGLQALTKQKKGVWAPDYPQALTQFLNIPTPITPSAVTKPIRALIKQSYPTKSGGYKGVKL